MKKISDIIKESIGERIDQYWIDNEKPVMTKDKRQAIILDIDISKVPNIYKGQVKIDNKMCDYQWDDTGKCILATDKLGNNVKPDENDDLVKGA